MNKLRIFKNSFITFSSDIVFYIENNNYYLLSISSARKYNESSRFFLIFDSVELVKMISLFKYRKNKYLFLYFQLNENTIEKQKMKYFKETFYENKGKLKIIGRGWKIVKYSYQLVIKLGYSHMIFLNLSPIIKYKLKKKKDKYYLFYGLFHNELNSILNKIKLMRIPDTYTNKGIFHRTIIL